MEIELVKDDEDFFIEAMVDNILEGKNFLLENILEDEEFIDEFGSNLDNEELRLLSIKILSVAFPVIMLQCQVSGIDDNILGKVRDDLYERVIESDMINSKDEGRYFHNLTKKRSEGYTSIFNNNKKEDVTERMFDFFDLVGKDIFNDNISRLGIIVLFTEFFKSYVPQIFNNTIKIIKDNPF